MNELLNKPVLDVEDIQAILDCGKRQTYELVHSGVFPHVRVGRRIKVSTPVFLKWLNGDM
nr:helix-turn-helix domain-containing protein [Metabacillus sp. cB07]